MIVANCAMIAALGIAGIIRDGCTANAAAVPPPRLARSLTDEQVRRAVSNAPSGARFSVPPHFSRQSSPTNNVHPSGVSGRLPNKKTNKGNTP
jgi:hypothetical protein